MSYAAGQRAQLDVTINFYRMNVRSPSNGIYALKSSIEFAKMNRIFASGLIAGRPLSGLPMERVTNSRSPY